MDTILSYLPQHEGLLPKWLLFTSLIAAGNVLQAYKTIHYSQRVYTSRQGHPESFVAKHYPNPLAPYSGVTPLSSRTFGTWTLLSCIVRAYAAYHIEDPVIYQLGIWTYVIAWWHFTSEWLLFGSASLGAGLASTIVVANISLAWMLTQWGYYVQ